MAMQQVSDKNTLKTYFIKFWSSQNVSNNCCEKIREVFRLWKKFRYFFSYNKSRKKSILLIRKLRKYKMYIVMYELDVIT